MAQESDIQTAIGRAVWILEQLESYVQSNAENFDTHEDDLKNTLGTISPSAFVFAPEALAALQNVRSGLDSTMRVGAAMLGPLIQEYGRTLQISETDVPSILRRIKQDFRDNSKTIAERDFSFGTITAASGVGDGVINRLTVDEEGDSIEETWPESITAECIADQHSSGGVEHEETFEFRGEDRGRDSIGLRGSGNAVNIKALSAADSLQYLQNPSFSDDAASTSPTQISGWTIDTGAISDFQVSSAESYRGFSGDLATPQSLAFETNVAISQNFSNRAVQLDPNVPMYAQVAYKANSGAVDGTVTLTVGSQTTTAALNTAAASGWNILRMTIGTKNWFNVFNQENPTVGISLTSNTTGSGIRLWVDDVIFAPFRRFNNIWYAPVGGETPFLRKKKFTFTHSITTAAEEGLIQKWLWRIYGVSLPSTASTPTWADPT